MSAVIAYDREDDNPTDTEGKFAQMRKRFQACVDAETDLRAAAIDDFRFIWIAGSQWDNNFGTLRGTRPKYEFNKLRQAVKQVVNDIRQNTPAIKVRPTEDGDVDLAEIRQGIIRNIEQQSNSDTVYDWGGLYSVSAGFGAWRIKTAYTDDDSFDQEIRIERVHNPFSIRFDPDARSLDRRDSQFAFVEDDISRAEFKRRWPKADCSSFGFSELGDTATLRHWYGEKCIKIAEYWQRVPTKRTMLLLSNEEVVDAAEFDEAFWANPPPDPQTGQPTPPITVTNKRVVETTKVTMEIVSGQETLEGPFDWQGKFIPLIPVWGDFVHVDGRDEWYGMARHARDAAILNNFALSTFAEQVASQPSAPFMYTAEQIKGYENEWRDLATSNAPGLPYNPDERVPGGRPERQMPPQMSPAYLTLLNVTGDAIKSTTGIYDASLGQRSNETSGKAIIARQREGDVANFDYSDSIARAIRFTGEVIDDLIPHVYDSPRSMRILGEDGTHKFVKVNEPVQNPQTGEWEVRNDLRQGKYDITISTGPSYTTQRMETLDACMQLAKSAGPMAALAQYGVLKNMDTPGMDEIKDGMRDMLVAQKLLKPKENDPQPQAPPPDPRVVAMVNKIGADIGRIEAETEQTKVETSLLPMQAQAQVRADLSTAIANEVKSMIDSGELDAMIRYNAQQLSTGAMPIPARHLPPSQGDPGMGGQMPPQQPQPPQAPQGAFAMQPTGAPQ